MQQPQMFFLSIALGFLIFGVARLFFAERFYYWREGLKYAYPLEPSTFKLRMMRLSGVLQVFAGLFLAHCGISR